MSNAIDFLERIGQDARLRYADTAQLKQAFQAIGLSPGDSDIILRRDSALLTAHLGAKANVCCTIEPAHEIDPELSAS